MEQLSNLTVDSTPRPQAWSWKRRFAVGLIVTPFIVASPLRYWAFHHAGSWFVSTSLEPTDRQLWLGLTYLALICSITVVAHFVASILLIRDQCFPKTSLVASVLYGIVLLPAIASLLIFVQCYLKFG
jgi:hypothetical protein